MFDIIKKPKKAKEKATEAMVESLQPEVKKANPWPRPQHYPTCECHKCLRWKAAENA